MAITLVQRKLTVDEVGGGGVTATFDSPTTAGNLLVVVAMTDDATHDYTSDGYFDLPDGWDDQDYVEEDTYVLTGFGLSTQGHFLAAREWATGDETSVTVGGAFGTTALWIAEFAGAVETPSESIGRQSEVDATGAASYTPVIGGSSSHDGALFLDIIFDSAVYEGAHPGFHGSDFYGGAFVDGFESFETPGVLNLGWLFTVIMGEHDGVSGMGGMEMSIDPPFGWSSNFMGLTLLFGTPPAVAAEPPVTDDSAQFTLRSRRVALQELPHQVTSTHLGRPI